MLKFAFLFFLFVAALLFFQAIFQLIFKRQLTIKQRMEEFITIPKMDVVEEKEPKKKSVWLERAREYLASKTSSETKRELEKKLRDAGYPPSWTAVDFRFLQSIIAGTLFFLAIVLFARLTDKVLSVTFLAAALGALGFYFPLFSLSARKKKRIERVQKTMAEFFDMVNLSVEAGMGLDAAILRVCKHTSGPLSEEFTRAIEDMRLGKSRREAFILLRNRIPLDAFQSVMTTLIQADQLGIGLSKALRALTERIREHQRQVAREKAMKAPVKMIFPMLLFIFPSVFIILLGPIAIYFITHGL